MQTKQSTTSKGTDDGLFLPDFCSIQMLLIVIIIAELLAFVLTLAASPAGQRLIDLSLISLFVQWLALGSVLLLCLLRPLLRKFNNTSAGVISFLLLLLLTLLISELAYQYVGRIFVLDEKAFSNHYDFLLRNLGISAIINAVTLRYFYIQYCSRQSLRAENSSRIEALQSRIRPHFLFNSMNVIASLTRKDPRLAEQAVESLSQVFRASLSSAQEQISLADELSICKSYLHIEHLRLGERLQCSWDVDETALTCSIPALLLQPLVENAVIHGIEPLAEGGEIRITATNSDQRLAIMISNPCGDDESASSGNRIAQENIRQRLEAFYKGRASMLTESKSGRYIVRLELPARRAAGESGE